MARQQWFALLVFLLGSSARGAETQDLIQNIIVASPESSFSASLPAGDAVADFEVSPAGSMVALVLKEADGTHRVALWSFASRSMERSIGIPAGFGATSIAWHPDAKRLFLILSAPSGHAIAKIDLASSAPAAETIYRSEFKLRRVVVSTRPFGTGKGLLHRLYFGEQQPDGGFLTKTVTENGDLPYIAIGPTAPKVSPDVSQETEPSTLIAPWSLPVQFSAFGSTMIWEDKGHCLNKALYSRDRWGDTTRLNQECSGSYSFAPNSAYLIHWRQDHPGVTVIGLFDQSKSEAAQQERFTSPPSMMPDGKGLVGVVKTDQGLELHFQPVVIPLADVANAWMFISSPDSAQHFQRNGGLFRAFGGDQLYKLYDTESYSCGYSPDGGYRPYFVTTDLFWENFGAAFEGIFMMAERNRAILGFSRFVDLTLAELRPSGKAPHFTRSLEAVQAVIHGQGQKNALAVKEIFGNPDTEPRGHYTKSEESKNYFRAVRYLTTLPIDKNEIEELRTVSSLVSGAAANWIDTYRPFIAPSRIPLIWNSEKERLSVASHAPKGSEAGVFPLSWGWDNEVLDNVIEHSWWPEDEQVTGRTTPSGLDFAAVEGDALALSIIDKEEFVKWPRLRERIAELRKRFSQDHRSETLYERWLDALAQQWTTPEPSNPVAGKLWETKRLQTGLASWATLRHSTILVNDRSDAECGEGGFEFIDLQPPLGYVEPDPAAFGAIADLFESARVAVTKPGFSGSAKDSELIKGIERRLAQARDETRLFGAMAAKELRGEQLTKKEYEMIERVGGTAEYAFLTFTSLQDPNLGIVTPDPMAKVADVTTAPGTWFNVAVGNPLEWDQIVPFYGRREIVKGAVYSYREFTSHAPITDEGWRGSADSGQLEPWVSPFYAKSLLECPPLIP